MCKQHNFGDTDKSDASLVFSILDNLLMVLFSEFMSELLKIRLRGMTFTLLTATVFHNVIGNLPSVSATFYDTDGCKHSSSDKLLS